jgi:hypothetical protein
MLYSTSQFTVKKKMGPAVENFLLIIPETPYITAGSPDRNRPAQEVT